MSLATTIDAVAAVAVVLDGETVLTWTPDDGHAQVLTADLPRRIVAPLASQTEGEGVQVMTLGGLVRRRWQLRDLLLFRAAGTAEPIQLVLPSLVAYMDAYQTAMVNGRKLNNAARITAIALDMGMFAYPTASKRMYFGVAADLTIEE